MSADWAAGSCRSIHVVLEDRCDFGAGCHRGPLVGERLVWKCCSWTMFQQRKASADIRNRRKNTGKCLIWYVFSSSRPYWLVFWALKTSWIVSICVLPAVPAADLNSRDVVHYKVSVFTAAFLTLCSKVSIFTVAPSMRAFHELVFYSQFKHDV